MSNNPWPQPPPESNEQRLFARVAQLEFAIRHHHAQTTGHSSCWENDVELWKVVGIDEYPHGSTPPWPEFMANCVTYCEGRFKNAPELKDMSTWLPMRVNHPKRDEVVTAYRLPIGATIGPLDYFLAPDGCLSPAEPYIHGRTLTPSMAIFVRLTV